MISAEFKKRLLLAITDEKPFILGACSYLTPEDERARIKSCMNSGNEYWDNNLVFILLVLEAEGVPTP